MTNSVKFTIDKIAVANSFSKAALHYDQFAQLQRDIGNRLFTSLDTCSLDSREPGNCLDLGCGTGYFSGKLINEQKIKEVICFDLSSGMLNVLQNKLLQNKRPLSLRCIQGDMDFIPFSDNQFSTIFSNLAVQWSSDLSRMLIQLKRILASGGELNFSTLLAGSLKELSDAWLTLDSYPHTNTFLTLADIQQMLAEVGFTKVTIETETITLYYQNVLDLMRDLKGIGANQVHGHHLHKSQGRSLINKLELGYAKDKTRSGLLPLSYQVCYIKAIK
ncbi:malonyl-ACP O-methyltransferase BioC [Psychromonas sp. MB-3u-54]|uniref:malonyl-ACP O-methyltransferase BioC n=1 Tax=Psychromonas sp. MB-3u-54 TaxID=2058319 RepID=UPI001E4EBC10|nr:malonyl-ACP O-methyltransferase BioC [Psychromonas sp. MB-3u-54]